MYICNAKLSFPRSALLIIDNQTGSYLSNHTLPHENTYIYSWKCTMGLFLAPTLSIQSAAWFSASSRKIDRTKPKLHLEILGKRVLIALYIQTYCNYPGVFLESSASVMLLVGWLYALQKSKYGSPFFAESYVSSNLYYLVSYL